MTFLKLIYFERASCDHESHEANRGPCDHESHTLCVVSPSSEDLLNVYDHLAAHSLLAKLGR